MRRSCNALTTMLACLACTVWAVGPSHSEAKAKHGWAGPIDCGYQPEIGNEGANDWIYDLPNGDLAPSCTAAHSNSTIAKTPVESKTESRAATCQPAKPAWLGCGGLPGWPCGNFLAVRTPDATAPYTYSPYWGLASAKVVHSPRTANPVWFTRSHRLRRRFRSVLASKSTPPSSSLVAKCIKSEPVARVHWDALDDYTPCPLAQDEEPATASMAALEGHRVSGCEAEYNYMSAHDAAFGNAWPVESSLDLNDYQDAAFAGRPASELDYRPWNCDVAIGSSEVAGESFRQIVDYSSQASRWIAIAAARTLEYYGAMLSDLSLTMETAARQRN